MVGKTQWTGTVTIHRLVLCPICGEAVDPKAWRAFRGIVTCEACHVSNPKGRLGALNSIRENPNHRLLTTRRGLVFYTPITDAPPGRPDPYPRSVPYAEHPREIAARRGRAKSR